MSGPAQLGSDARFPEIAFLEGDDLKQCGVDRPVDRMGLWSGVKPAWAQDCCIELVPR
jgi:hypothetical protein